jgi:hypothetical protein
MGNPATGGISQEIIETEFQWISRESDVLIQAFSPELGELKSLLAFFAIAD